MKNYSSNRAQKGKTAYRTPSGFKVRQSQFAKMKIRRLGGLANKRLGNMANRKFGN